MESEIKKCYRCERFERYYFKAGKGYAMTKTGWCYEKRSLTESRSGCDKFVDKPKK